MATRLGHALQQLAADLAVERRRVSALQRENAKLRAELRSVKAYVERA